MLFELPVEGCMRHLQTTREDLSMNILQTEEDLRDQLKVQIGFLVQSSDAYDRGNVDEAKRLAIALRILLHDKGRTSVSLLTLLNKKDILFYDTALEYNPNNLLSMPGLVMLKAGPDGGEYIPPLDMRCSKGKIPFPQWWSNIVVVDIKGNKSTRKDLVLTVCEKDGGAHVDPKLDEAYYAFSRSNSLGWKYQKDGVVQDFTGRPELASIRQVAYEVLKSLKDEFPEHFEQ